MKIQRRDQHKQQHYQVVEKDCVEAEEVGGKFLNILRGIDKIRVYRGQKKGGGCHGCGNATHSLLIFAAVKCHNEGQEDQQRAKVKWQMVQVVALFQG